MIGCRLCKAQVRDGTYLQLASKAIKGVGAVCLSCVDKEIHRRGSKTVGDFVTAYLREEKPDTVQSLKARIAELEARLAAATVAKVEERYK